MNTQPNTNICLNMIVKNETRVLPRLFKSVHRYIDSYVIVDTGSTDSTPELIESEMKKYNINGEIHHREWVNFGHNRQQALELAQKAGLADWLLFIDADEEFDVSDPEFYKKLKPGISYELEKHHGNMRYALPALIDISRSKWEWKGVVHNYLDHLTPNPTELIKDAWIIYHPFQGAKSHGVTPEEKYLRDAKLLKAELNKNPNDTRSQFYLGQSYLYAGRNHDKKALKAYIKRAQMDNGWVEEKYISLLEAGSASARLQKPFDRVMGYFLKAHQLIPSRAEAHHRAAFYCRSLKNYHLAYVFAKASTDIPMPESGLFLNQVIYQWSRWDELAVAANQTGRYQESVSACDKVFQAANQGIDIPEADLERIKKNRKLSLRALKSNK